MSPALEAIMQRIRMAAKLAGERESFDLPLIAQNLKAGAAQGKSVTGSMGDMLMTARRNRLEAMGEAPRARELFDEYKSWRKGGNS